MHDDGGEGPGHDGPTGVEGPREAAEPAVEDLEALRCEIDGLDRRLVALLNERARVVARVGESKRRSGAPIYAPDREARVLAKVLELNEGPLPDRSIEAIYKELMSGSFAIERPLRIAYLGPAGSFSHHAAVSHFGSSVSYEDVTEISAVFTEVLRGHVDYGLVPIENSTGGGIVETLDAFMTGPTRPDIYAEILVEIRHNLLANCEPSEVRRIYSKPEVFAQCRRFVSVQYPQAELISAPSSSRAAIMAFEALRDDPHCGAAAIASRLAGQLYGLGVLFESIEDNPDNITRFLVLAREQAPPTGDDKTSLTFRTEDAPGALLEVLAAFARHGVNLSHIDKRPSGRENWTYTFFVDALGHRHDRALVAAVEDARAHCRELTVLGAYPRARRVL